MLQHARKRYGKLLALDGAEAVGGGMSLQCTRCQGTGFLNAEQIPDDIIEPWNSKTILRWIEEHDGHDVTICDCCGDSEEWYGEPGEHYNAEDPPGHKGPYTYNGGLCECH